MRKKKNQFLIGIILIITATVFIIITNSCSKSTEPTEIVFTALPYASDDFALGYTGGINNDGTIVCGSGAVNTPDDGKYFEIAPVIWTNDVITVLPFMREKVQDFPRQGTVTDISETGIMAGFETLGDFFPEAYYYANNQWHEIINPSSSIQAQTAEGISSDGTIIVGMSGWNDVEGGYYYNVSTGSLTVLASTFKDSADYTDAKTNLYGISGDGTLMVGSDCATKFDTIAVKLPMYFNMAKDTLPTILPLPSGYTTGAAQGISNDGSTILGHVYDDEETPYAAYWDENRQAHLLGTFCPYPGPLQPATIAYAASDNGDRIVGTSYEIAFIKFKNDQMFSLQEWLEDEGLASELADWRLITATGITTDGHWIAGTGMDGVYTRAFKVYIP